MTIIGADVEAGTGANRKWEYDQFAWGTVMRQAAEAAMVVDSV